MKLINQFYRIFFVLLAPYVLLAACKKSTSSDFDVNSNVQIQSFSINNYAGEIDHKSGTITVHVPFNTDLSALSANVELPSGAVSSPASGTVLNYTGDVQYRITNGNLYKNYTVKVMITPPIKSFTINGVAGTIDQENKAISVLLPNGTQLNSLKPEVVLESGVTIKPGSGVAIDFTNPVTYTVTMGNKSVVYQVTAISNSVSEYAFLGLAASRAAISDPDEKAAADWFFTNYPTADYVSFQNIEAGRRLSNYKVIWWHYNSAQDLPAAALTPTVVNSLKEFRTNGGNLLLTTYAARYVEALGIVPEGRGPNNVFGDFGTAGFVASDNWGISFRGHENHPVFAGVETYETGKAWLLEAGTFRQNHTAWWFLPEWGGYGNAATWRTLTGGINLASEAWDDNLDGRVGIAEWKTENEANAIIIAFDAYDWYNEPLNGGKATNAYITNIRRITKNSIDYLKDH